MTANKRNNFKSEISFKKVSTPLAYLFNKYGVFFIKYITPIDKNIKTGTSVFTLNATKMGCKMLLSA